MGKITIITAWGSEAKLASYFLNHYAYVDEIIILYGLIEDETLEIVAQYPNARLIEVEYPNGRWSMWIKQAQVDEQVKRVQEGWLYYVDADEFIFPLVDGKVIEDPHDFLDKADGNLMKAYIWQVFRNEKEGDLIPELPPAYQRRYGDPDFGGDYNHHYVKPIIAKAEIKPVFHPGGHRVFDPERFEWSSQQFFGTHWHLADVEITVEREMRKERLIVDDQKWLTDGITEATIRDKCKAHLNDPRLF